MKAAKQPWMRWYPADWRGDPRLRMCSLAARGLWADLISYMHEGEPYGHLVIDGRVPSDGDIAALVGRPLSEVRKALAELRQRNVCSVDDGGALVSRRMIRDNEKAEKDRINGRGGGNPAIKPKHNGGVTQTIKPRSQKPEARG